MTAAEPGRDSAGDAVPSWKVGDVVVSIGSECFTLCDVEAIEGPNPFLEWGVGGFLSPQSLAPGATVLLDLAQERIDILGEDVPSVEADLLSRFEHFVRLEGARHVAGTVGIDLRIPPGPPVVAFFDTGAPDTEVAASALAMPIEGTAQSSGQGVGGSTVDAMALKDQRLEVGAVEIQIPSLGVRSEIPAPEDAASDEIPLALVGTDVLRGTVLAITPRDHGLVWWFVPDKG